MKDRLSTRALVTLEGCDVPLRGTYHKPLDRLAEQDLETSAAGRTGLMFLNSLSAPRAGNGDCAVYWAEAFAASGYPCFRFDLPGLGDSPGNLPGDFLSFVMGGGYADRIRQKVKELADRFRLTGVIVLGHCAGAVTALHAASEQASCKGLILMDPRFDLPKRATTPKLPLGLTVWSRTTPLGKLFRTPYDWTRSMPIAVHRQGLPLNANVALLNQWKQAASSGLPILILESAAVDPQTGQFDYTKFAVGLAGRKARLARKLVADTDHSFADTIGRDAVRRHIQDWLSEQFPLAHGEKALPGCSLSVSAQDSESSLEQASCVHACL